MTQKTLHFFLQTWIHFACKQSCLNFLFNFLFLLMAVYWSVFFLFFFTLRAEREATLEEFVESSEDLEILFSGCEVVKRDASVEAHAASLLVVKQAELVSDSVEIAIVKCFDHLRTDLVGLKEPGVGVLLAHLTVVSESRVVSHWVDLEVAASAVVVGSRLFHLLIIKFYCSALLGCFSALPSELSQILPDPS